MINSILLFFSSFYFQYRNKNRIEKNIKNSYKKIDKILFHYFDLAKKKKKSSKN